MYSVKPNKERSLYIFCVLKKSIGDNTKNSEIMITLKKLWKTVMSSSNEEKDKHLRSLQEEVEHMYYI